MTSTRTVEPFVLKKKQQIPPEPTPTSAEVYDPVRQL